MVLNESITSKWMSGLLDKNIELQKYKIKEDPKILRNHCQFPRGNGTTQYLDGLEHWCYCSGNIAKYFKFGWVPNYVRMTWDVDKDLPAMDLLRNQCLENVSLRKVKPVYLKIKPKALKL